MLSVIYAECHIKALYAECHIQVHYAECHIQAHNDECHYAECRNAECLGAGLKPLNLGSLVDYSTNGTTASGLGPML
jgi:hypothetical protein